MTVSILARVLGAGLTAHSNMPLQATRYQPSTVCPAQVKKHAQLKSPSFSVSTSAAMAKKQKNKQILGVASPSQYYVVLLFTLLLFVMTVFPSFPLCHHPCRDNWFHSLGCCYFRDIWNCCSGRTQEVEEEGEGFCS